MKIIKQGVILACCLIGAEAAYAQDAAQGQGHSRHGERAGPQAGQINARLHGQYRLLHAGMESGKINVEDELSVEKDLKNIRAQELVFLKQNGTHDLTADQAAQLNQALDQNSSLLGETTDLDQATPEPTEIP